MNLQKLSHTKKLLRKTPWVLIKKSMVILQILQYTQYCLATQFQPNNIPNQNMPKILTEENDIYKSSLNFAL